MEGNEHILEFNLEEFLLMGISTYQLDDGTIFYWNNNSTSSTRLYAKKNGKETVATLPDDKCDCLGSHGDAIFLRSNEKIYKASIALPDTSTASYASMFYNMFFPQSERIQVSYVRDVLSDEFINRNGTSSRAIAGKDYVCHVGDDPEHYRLLVDVEEKNLSPNLKLSCIHRDRTVYISYKSNKTRPCILELGKNALAIEIFHSSSNHINVFANDSSPFIYLAQDTILHTIDTDTMQFLPDLQTNRVSIVAITSVRDRVVTAQCCFDFDNFIATADLPRGYYKNVSMIDELKLNIQEMSKRTDEIERKMKDVCERNRELEMKDRQNEMIKTDLLDTIDELRKKSSINPPEKLYVEAESDNADTATSTVPADPEMRTPPPPPPLPSDLNPPVRKPTSATSPFAQRPARPSALRDGNNIQTSLMDELKEKTEKILRKIKENEALKGQRTSPTAQTRPTGEETPITSSPCRRMPPPIAPKPSRIPLMNSPAKVATPTLPNVPMVPAGAPLDSHPEDAPNNISQENDRNSSEDDLPPPPAHVLTPSSCKPIALNLHLGVASMPPPHPPPPSTSTSSNTTDAHSNLLEEIRGGRRLKKVKENHGCSRLPTQEKRRVLLKSNYASKSSISEFLIEVFIIDQPSRAFINGFYPFFEVVYAIELRPSMFNLILQALIGSTSRLIFIYNQYSGQGPQAERLSMILGALLRIAMAETFVAMFFFFSVERIIATFAWSWYEKASPRTLIVFVVLETCAMGLVLVVRSHFISKLHFLIGILCTAAVGGTVDFTVVLINYRFYQQLKTGASVEQYSVARTYQIHENVVILKVQAKIEMRMVIINFPLFILSVYQYFMLGDDQHDRKMLLQAIFDLLISMYPASLVTYIQLSDEIFERSLKRLPHGNQLFRFYTYQTQVILAMSLLFIATALIAVLSYFLIRRDRRTAQIALLEEKIRLRRKERESDMKWAEEEGKKISDELRDKIGALDFEQLRVALQNGDFTCSEVVSAYYTLALKANENINAIVLFIKESRQWAAEWDERAKRGEKKPMLFGVPVSIKECTDMKGYDQTRGYAAAIHHPAEHDSPLVVQLKELGAIPFVQTNVPTSLLSYNCGNSIYGWTENPYKKGRTPGGSSGGESSLIAAGGSVLGIGGDVGGSLRTPAHYTGIAAIKPSHLRFSEMHSKGSVPGRPLINSSDGPMARSIDTCAHICKQMWSSNFQSEFDPYVPPVPWRDELYEAGKKWKIGYYKDDGWFTPTPGCARMVEEAKKALEAKGHTLIPFSPPDVPEIYRLFVCAVCVDGGAYLMNLMDNDIVPDMFLETVFPMRFPIVLQRAAAHVAGWLGYPRLKKLAQSMPMSTSGMFIHFGRLSESTKLRQNYAAIEAYRHTFLGEMKKAGVDILLCPASVMPAPPHEGPLQLSCGVSYCSIFNLLDFGAGVCRAGNWTEDDELKLRDYPETDMWYTMAKGYSKDSVGLPLGVQVAAPPYMEEAVLRVLSDIEHGLKQ
ncbi:faah-2 [Pristionchus pacificus]|uniref:fatty acid amide hydrolase n=1 Tax=Pristionchus pacificus TaxID=54126 RepID=A0A2A6CQK0_PRIPA|nr:faah-2 [Pristionchus pacificus]|eukprot:PDM80311.1 faah-2 [Pristionchus pacificus]